MRYGVIATIGDPRALVDLAVEAEAAGWDGFFYFDGIAIGTMELYDPWVVLAAIAQRTERLRIGAILTPPSRRRPWKLAREAMTLDRLSGGRLVLPVGLGTLDDAAFGNVGEPTDARTRAQLLDESLDILEGLWSGQPFAYQGQHYHFDEMTFLPTPVQQPRIHAEAVGGVWLDGDFATPPDPAPVRPALVSDPVDLDPPRNRLRLRRRRQHEPEALSRIDAVLVYVTPDPLRMVRSGRLEPDARAESKLVDEVLRAGWAHELDIERTQQLVDDPFQIHRHSAAHSCQWFGVFILN